MKKFKKKILIICPYPFDFAPGQRFKYEQYLGYLRTKGYHFTISPFFTVRAYKILYEPGMYLFKILSVLRGLIKRVLTIFKLPFYDGVYIFLNVSPIFSIFEKIYLKISKKIIYDIDDMVFFGSTSHVNKWAAFLKNNSKYFDLIKYSNYVITCTEYLHKISKKLNNNSVDISSTIDCQKYKVLKIQKKNVTIGWSGSYSTGKYLLIIKEILKKLVKKNICEVLVIGAKKNEINENCFKYLKWNKKNEIKNLQKIDIGVYPLPRNDWIKGKSGLKALQYMALGKPVVASAVGSNYRIIKHDHSGYLIKRTNDWEYYLLKLIKNEKLRKKFGINARKTVLKNFSVNANKDKYLEVFNNVFKKN
jgi:glycosyltransferase involved in cell wall biosynthesis